MKFLPYILVDSTPIVAFQVDGVCEIALADVGELIPQLPRRTHLLIHFPWHSMYDLACELALMQTAIGERVYFHLMANTEKEAKAFRPFGLPVLHAPASLYVSERTFSNVTAQKEHDAIYVANFRPGQRNGVKRH